MTQSIVTSQSSPHRVGLNIGVQTLLSDYIGRRHALALGMTLALIVALAALFWAGSAWVLSALCRPSRSRRPVRSALGTPFLSHCRREAG